MTSLEEVPCITSLSSRNLINKLHVQNMQFTAAAHYSDCVTQIFHAWVTVEVNHYNILSSVK